MISIGASGWIHGHSKHADDIYLDKSFPGAHRKDASMCPKSAAAPAAAPAANSSASSAAAGAASGTAAASGVLGARATLTRPATKPAGGVLGTVARLGSTAKGTLPFTGLPVWIAVLVALALLSAGLVMRRHARPSRI